MRVTFDSNAWQKVVVPNLARKTSLYDAFAGIHEALRVSKIQGFVCETVGTLEAIKRPTRKTYFTSIKPAVKVQSNAKGNQILMNINIGANHDQHPGLPPVLRERLELAFDLGIRLMRAPRIGVPVPSLFLICRFSRRKPMFRSRRRVTIAGVMWSGRLSSGEWVLVLCVCNKAGSKKWEKLNSHALLPNGPTGVPWQRTLRIATMSFARKTKAKLPVVPRFLI